MRAFAIGVIVAVAGCGDDATPSGTVDAPGGDGDGGDGDAPDGSPPGPANIMFTTSTTHDGALGGLAGADAICAARAAAGGHAGTFRAYLSTDAEDAKQRLGTARGWVRVDGKPFADTVADVAAGRIFYPARLDEMGNDLVAAVTEVHTGTTVTGEVAPQTCTNFTVTTGQGAYGSATGGDVYFVNAGYGVCTAPRHVYCFGVDKTAQVNPPSQTGKRRAFVVTSWSPNAGLAAADAACNAAGASLGGTFKAFLATSTATAASRFSATGANWVRPHDGVEVAASPAALLAGDLTAAIMHEVDGTATNGYVITGGMPNVVPAVSSTCNDWSSVSVNDSMTAGTVTSTTHQAFDRTGMLCNTTVRTIRCLEE